MPSALQPWIIITICNHKCRLFINITIKGRLLGGSLALLEICTAFRHWLRLKYTKIQKKIAFVGISCQLSRECLFFDRFLFSQRIVSSLIAFISSIRWRKLGGEFNIGSAYDGSVAMTAKQRETRWCHRFDYTELEEVVIQTQIYVYAA